MIKYMMKYLLCFYIISIERTFFFLNKNKNNVIYLIFNKFYLKIIVKMIGTWTLNFFLKQKQKQKQCYTTKLYF